MDFSSPPPPANINSVVIECAETEEGRVIFERKTEKETHTQTVNERNTAKKEAEQNEGGKKRETKKLKATSNGHLKSYLDEILTSVFSFVGWVIHQLKSPDFRSDFQFNASKMT